MKYYLETDRTPKGHMGQTRKNVKPTKKHKSNGNLISKPNKIPSADIEKDTTSQVKDQN